jgi:hypothetical protein
MAWEAVNGRVPDGLWVLHHCDNPPCVNPAHLYVGTHADNMRDMRERRRHWYHADPANIIRGERSGAAKLTEAQVRELRRLHDAGRSYGSLAREYGVSRQAVSSAITGRSWTHVLREPLLLWRAS